ncbi:transcriptional regulator [Achromobacter mucicolens]|uniref:transcriptional regulator n=1 Tax=Achromobacter mucicolens TaxID=1389922 RepID=UPI0024310B71|nr:transcriptional regulator [Achromobacter mucicolens]
MEAGVVAGVESGVDSSGVDSSGAGIHVHMLGPMRISRGGVPLALPPSRKLRALIAYLALAPNAVMRSHLCELLWDIPNDPRGELRWCLSKARGLLDEPGRRRVETMQDAVRLDLSDCRVDVIDIGAAMQAGIRKASPERLRALAAMFAGDFLEGLEIGRSPFFHSWLTAQRRRLRACHTAVLAHQVVLLPEGSEERFACLDTWLALVPFDPQAHELKLDALGLRGQWREGEEHLAAAVRAFEAEGLDGRPLREAWRDVRARRAGGGPSSVQALSPAPAGAAAPMKPAPLPEAFAAGIAPQDVADTELPMRPADALPYRRGRASIAVMPFVDRSAQAGVRGGLADGLAFDVIARLAKLRSLFVIAQGTVFALDQRSVGPEEAGRTLNVDYVVSGSLRRHGHRLAVDVQLVESRTARIVWADVLDHPFDDALLALDEIGNRIVASVDIEIEAAERNRAILTPPNSLDAWQAHHRGLWHMYRFNRTDNEQARHFFEMAVRLDPTFSRAYAGLSFTHWQTAFQRWGEQEAAINQAFESAGQSLIADDRDPAAHWAMGRALWLRGSQDQSVSELRIAVDLSPNFALAHYTLGFVDCQMGDAEAAIGASDHSRHLSPFDPLLFGMLAVRALALVRLGRIDEAAGWAVKAAARPNAHVHILAIAACCLALAGRTDEALGFLPAIRKAQPSYRVEDFLASFRLEPDTQALFREGARRIGIG